MIGIIFEINLYNGARKELQREVKTYALEYWKIQDSSLAKKNLSNILTVVYSPVSLYKVHSFLHPLK